MPCDYDGNDKPIACARTDQKTLKRFGPSMKLKEHRVSILIPLMVQLSKFVSTYQMTEAVCRLTTQFPRIDSVATRRQKDFIVLSDRRCYDNT